MVRRARGPEGEDAAVEEEDGGLGEAEAEGVEEEGVPLFLGVLCQGVASGSFRRGEGPIIP